MLYFSPQFGDNFTPDPEWPVASATIAIGIPSLTAFSGGRAAATAPSRRVAALISMPASVELRVPSKTVTAISGTRIKTKGLKPSLSAVLRPVSGVGIYLQVPTRTASARGGGRATVLAPSKSMGASATPAAIAIDALLSAPRHSLAASIYATQSLATSLTIPHKGVYVKFKNGSRYTGYTLEYLP